MISIPVGCFFHRLESSDNILHLREELNKETDKQLTSELNSFVSADSN